MVAVKGLPTPTLSVFNGTQVRFFCAAAFADGRCSRIATSTETSKLVGETTLSFRSQATAGTVFACETVYVGERVVGKRLPHFPHAAALAALRAGTHSPLSGSIIKERTTR
ncbi:MULTISPECIES: hypothetical protein [unclassified Caballeronia]|uniref:hypothetical protein n=1 Tax=unclassified Caballeronia TaxID=2646786 RepID=UPI002029111E|nr:MULTISPECIES: hypothetical protein [unclassified Caballeronia]MDR5785016.1 hypothetical protein [Caballeronia sp. LP003]